MLLHLFTFAALLFVLASAGGGVHQFHADVRPIPKDSPKHQQRLQRVEQIKASGGNSGQVNLVDYAFYALLATIKLGTPAQTFLVELDNYSQDWWVISAAAPFVDQDGTRVKTRFFANQSTSYVDTNTRFSAFWGFVDGELGNDTFQIGSLSLVNTTVGVADNVTCWLSYYVSDSIFGIQITNNMTTALNQVLMTLDKPIITLFVNGTGSDSLFNGTAVVTMGGEDTATCGSTYTYLPFSVSSTWNYWTLPLGNATINGQVVGNASQGLLVFPDTTGFYTKNSTGYAIASLYGGTFNDTSGFFDVDCSQINSAASSSTVGLSFTSSGGANSAPTIVSLKMEDFFVNNGGVCYLAIHPVFGDDSDTTWVIGQPFLSNRCMAANVKDQTVGFSHIKTS